MSHLLVLYEIAEKASKVSSRTALKAYERWIADMIRQYHDAAIEHAARVQLFRLKEQFA